LQEAEQLFEASEMGLNLAAVRYCRGRLIGGEAGAALTTAALVYYATEGVANPLAMAAIHTPGFTID
jgi:hypothetical protein